MFLTIRNYKKNLGLFIESLRQGTFANEEFIVKLLRSEIRSWKGVLDGSELNRESNPERKAELKETAFVKERMSEKHQ